MKKLLLLFLLDILFSSCERKAVVNLFSENKSIVVKDPDRSLRINDTVVVANYNGGIWELVDLSNLIDTTYSEATAYRVGVVKEIKH